MTKPPNILQRDARQLAGTPPTFRRLEIAAIASFPVTFALLAWRLWALFDVSQALLLASALLTGILLADFISGFAHWAFDTWFSPDTPFIGRSFVRTFREHHIDPTAICRHDFVETNGSNMLGGSFLFVCGLCTETSSAFGAFTAASLFSWGIFTAATSQIHKWAHTPEVPRAVRWLQRCRLIISEEAHDRHHHAPFADAYCISCGWLNTPLRVSRFFRVAERIVFVVTGALPRRDDIGDEAATTFGGGHTPACGPDV